MNKLDLNPIQRILKRKALNNGLCEICEEKLGDRRDYLCEWCRGIRNMETLKHRRPEDSALKCSTCDSVMTKEDIALSKIVSKETKKNACTCWKCWEKGGK